MYTLRIGKTFVKQPVTSDVEKESRMMVPCTWSNQLVSQKSYCIYSLCESNEKKKKVT